MLTAMRLILWLLIFSSFFTKLAYAEKADREKPFQLKTGKASYDDLKQIYSFSGGVVLIKGSITLHSATAEVRISPEGDEFAIAKSAPGKLVYLRQKTDHPNEFIEGYGETIEYDADKDFIRLIGKARLKRLIGNLVVDDIQGKLITRDGLHGIYQTQGDANAVGEDQRARIVISPRNSKALKQQPTLNQKENIK